MTRYLSYCVNYILPSLRFYIMFLLVTLHVIYSNIKSHFIVDNNNFRIADHILIFLSYFHLCLKHNIRHIIFRMLAVAFVTEITKYASIMSTYTSVILQNYLIKCTPVTTCLSEGQQNSQQHLSDTSLLESLLIY